MPGSKELATGVRVGHVNVVEDQDVMPRALAALVQHQKRRLIGVAGYPVGLGIARRSGAELGFESGLAYTRFATDPRPARRATNTRRVGYGNVIE